jgi:hypothetical protein
MNRERINEWGKQVYRDLDDRHMLIPAIVLVVAIIAVPLLLGGGGSNGTVASPALPATETAPAAIKGSEEVDPVVLTEVPGLRDYRKRLDRFDARNPFQQQMVGGSGKGGSSGGGSGEGSSAADTSSSTGSGSTSSSSTSTDTSGSTSSGGTTPAPDDGGSSGGTVTKYIQITLDVKVGAPGKAKVLKGVEPLSYLPGKKTPVVQYVQGNLDATRAAFVVSPAVVSADGDGNCDPGRNDCQFLLMKKGDEQHFVYGNKLKDYKLKIIAINRKVIDAKNAKQLGRQAQKTSKATAHFVASLDQ